MTEQKVMMGLRIDADIAKRIREISKDERRTVSNTIQMLIIKGIKIYEHEKEVIEALSRMEPGHG